MLAQIDLDNRFFYDIFTMLAIGAGIIIAALLIIAPIVIMGRLKKINELLQSIASDSPRK